MSRPPQREYTRSGRQEKWLDVASSADPARAVVETVLRHESAGTARQVLIAAPGAALTNETGEDLWSWRLRNLALDDSATTDFSYPVSPAEIIRLYPHLRDWIVASGKELLQRWTATIVRPGDIVIDEDRAQRIQQRISTLRDQLSDAMPDYPWAAATEAAMSSPSPLSRLRWWTAEVFNELRQAGSASYVPLVDLPPGDSETAARLADLDD